MRILVACHRLPFPPDHGGKIRGFEMIRHLGARHSVTVATLAHTPQQVEQGQKLRDYCDELLLEVLPPAARWARAIAALPTARPSSSCYFWSTRLKRAIQSAAGRAPFDRILVHCAFMAPYVLDLPCDCKVLDYADIDSGKWREYSRHKRQPLALGYGIEAAKLRREERDLARRFSHCTVTTQNELLEFQSLGVPVPCTVVPNGVDLSYFSALPAQSPQAGQTLAAPHAAHPLIVFLGRMDYFPNADAVLHFAQHVFPRIRTEIPDVEFRIIGSDPTPAVRRLAADPAITVTGYVPDVRTHVSGAALAVAPLRIARGTQNKILEMMASGIPVVASPPAAKGIMATPGEHLLVADDPAQFAAHVLALLRDPDLRGRLAAAARAQVETAHSWPSAMKILDSVLRLPRTAPSDSSLAASEPLPTPR